MPFPVKKSRLTFAKAERPYLVLQKLLLVRKGLLLLLLCLLGKILFLGIFPEMKDPRISLSQSQYNKYLQKLHGESTPEKNDQVKYEYEQYLETIDLRETMEQKHKKLEISEEEYEEYAKELEQAFLRKNAAEIFSEKASQFSKNTLMLFPSISCALCSTLAAAPHTVWFKAVRFRRSVSARSTSSPSPA